MRLWSSQPVSSILATGLKVTGNIRSEGEVNVLGAVEGDVTARALKVYDEGMIKGRIDADTTIINGKFSGHIRARAVALGGTASVAAEIECVSLEVAPGAVYEGRVRHVEDLRMASAEVRQLPAREPEQTEKRRASA